MNTNSLAQQTAWNCLSEPERVSLKLGLGFKKSSWKAGEIMGKAHYKYLEIHTRAKYLFKRLTEYFDIYPELINPKSNISWEFKEYLELVILKRTTIKSAILTIDSPRYYIRKNRNPLIVQDMEILKNSLHVYDKRLYELVLDFDRWNNFRILPLSIQEPSAFKRRNKQRSRKLIKSLMDINELLYDHITRVYKAPKNIAQNQCYFVPLIKNGDPKDYTILKVKKSHLNKLTESVLILFGDSKDAQEFVTVLNTYWDNKKKHCRDGQVFWPIFRVILEKAINFSNLQNIQYSRKHIMLPSNESGLEF